MWESEVNSGEYESVRVSSGECGSVEEAIRGARVPQYTYDVRGPAYIRRLGYSTDIGQRIESGSDKQCPRSSPFQYP